MFLNLSARLPSSSPPQPHQPQLGQGTAKESPGRSGGAEGDGRGQARQYQIPVIHRTWEEHAWGLSARRPTLPAGEALMARAGVHT